MLSESLTSFSKESSDLGTRVQETRVALVQSEAAGLYCLRRMARRTWPGPNDPILGSNMNSAGCNPVETRLRPFYSTPRG